VLAERRFVASDRGFERRRTRRRLPRREPPSDRVEEGSNCSVDSRSISAHSRTGSVTRSRVCDRYRGACSEPRAMLSTRCASGREVAVNSGKSASPMCSAACEEPAQGRYSVSQ
jgi:hypothetical protein